MEWDEVVEQVGPAEQGEVAAVECWQNEMLDVWLVVLVLTAERQMS